MTLDTTPFRDVLLRWETLPFVDFLGSRMAVLSIEGGGGATGDAIVLAVDHEPDFIVGAHSHFCGHIEVILEGSQRVGDRWERAGDIRMIPADCAYGPLQTGPEGCKALEIFPDRRAVPPTLVNAAEVDDEHKDLIKRLRELIGI
jgi:hypothetical protein